MRKAISGYEGIVFLSAAIVFFISAVGAFAARSHLHLQNDRVRYGLLHLPGALLSAFLFTLLAWVLHASLVRAGRVREYSTAFYLGALGVAYCIYWLPVLLAGGFVQDDWLLLGAAAVRKIIFAHPLDSWYALDTVDGNFRPLGTVLYFGYMLKLFGASAHAFLTGSFLLSLLGCGVAFGIVRELGYSKIAGAAAALLYMSRGVLYTTVAWVSAISDAIAILLCGLVALLILKANKRAGTGAVLYHVLAWVFFCLATLGKQSSFAAPLIVALLLLLRPGEECIGSLARRAMSALVGLVVYGATAAVPFFHAKALLQTTSPYPIGFSFEAAMRSFAYVAWYFGNFDLPASSAFAMTLPEAVGAVIFTGLLLLAWKVPRMLGERPRDVLFAALATVASISLFAVLKTRVAPYYGTMAAFWMSIALAIALTRFGWPRAQDMRARLACFAFCVLVVSGYADVRVRQIALLPSGGYVWGTYGMDRERLQFDQMQKQFAAVPEKRTLILVDFPELTSYYASMALLAAPSIEEILTYNSQTRSFFANDLQGRRPGDDRNALRDPLAYSWTVPVDAGLAARIMPQEATLWLKFRDGNIERMDSTR